MAGTFNIYCDESCHLFAHDKNDHGRRVMVLGAVWCPTDKVRESNRRLREIKRRHELPASFEAKWTKVSPAKVGLYLDLVDYFFDDTDLHFRGIVIPDKSLLDHEAWGQDHDTWYYKMLFLLLEQIIHPGGEYHIYLDIKDTKSEAKRAGLERFLRNKKHDLQGEIVHKVQQIRSHESELMQVCDLLIGAIGYLNRGLVGSIAKAAIIGRIRDRSRKTLTGNTWLQERKLNLLVWQGRGAPR